MQISRLEGDKWAERTARIGFPILVEYAQQYRREITYGEWQDKIVRRELGNSTVPAVRYGHPAGRIGDVCKEYAARKKVTKPVPLINLMVVNEKSRVPGAGATEYLKHFCDVRGISFNPERCSVREKRAIIEHALEEIFDFPHWGDVLRTCGLDEPKKPHSPKRPHPRSGGWHTGPESEAHKTLKQQIAVTPAIVGVKTDENGVEEHVLWSGDKVDVYFAKTAVAVEVKTADAGFSEIHRGIFQCIKYRAVLRAQQVYDREIPTADCRLALGGVLPEELQDIAKLFKVRVVSC
ncbi:MAG: hypothetical protein OXT71_17020 [Acidobacteriota bacterium]|nr:hypothetical protein [Acidobacteriota bacterium]